MRKISFGILGLARGRGQGLVGQKWDSNRLFYPIFNNSRQLFIVINILIFKLISVNNHWLRLYSIRL